MVSSLFLWLLVILSIELALSFTASRAITFSLATILVITVLIIQSGFELLGITTIMAFSATTLLLYLLMLSTEGQAKLSPKLPNIRTSHVVLGLILLLMFLILCISVSIAGPTYNVR